MKRIAILGSTGSIGQSALAVVDAFPDRLQVVGLAAGENSDRLAEQIVRYHPRIAAMASASAVDRLRDRTSVSGTILTAGSEGLVAVASDPDVDLVLCASSGTDGLEAVLAAIEARKTVAIANKEVLVMAGGLVTEAARRRGVTILPVDSEHSAIHQCLHGRRPDELKRLVLTASGGPFRGRRPSELEEVSAAEALSHPTWRMGRKITIDSATLMNKGLEVIEARWLFGVRADQIAVVIHPQSIVHSLVELVDGSLLAQLGATDMRLPIQYTFSYPERWPAAWPVLDLARVGTLEFSEPDTSAFPCLRLAYRALEGDSSLAVVLNGANEVAVAQFLAGRIGFTSIAYIIERAMDAHLGVEVATLDEVRAIDRWTRQCSQEIAREVQLNV